MHIESRTGTSRPLRSKPLRQVVRFAGCALALSLAAAATPAQASSYCWISNNMLIDGGTATAYVKVVVSSVPRPFIAGQPKDRPWCYQDRSSLGGNNSNRIVEQPKLGQVTANGYRIRYRGDRIGHDRFVIEHTWLNGSTNKWQKGVLTFDVEVVPQPF
jgi:hypothetical protein